MLSLVRKNQVLDTFENNKILSDTKLTNYQKAMFFKQVAEATVVNTLVNPYIFELSYKIGLVECFSDYEIVDDIADLEFNNYFMKLAAHLETLFEPTGLKAECEQYCDAYAHYFSTPAGAIHSFSEQINQITNKIINVLDEIEQGARKIEPEDYEKVVDFAKRFGVDLGV